MLPLLLATLFYSSLANAESITIAEALAVGIEGITGNILEHSDRCSYPDLGKDMSERLGYIKTRHTDVIGRITGNMESLLNKTDEWLKLHPELAPKTIEPETSDGCSEPFQTVAGMCLWAYRGTSLTWSDAREFCQQEGGDLATPSNIPAVIAFLSEEIGSGWWDMWLGGRQNINGEWKWLDSDAEMEVDERLWDDQEDYPTEGRNSCTVLKGAAGFKIARQDCTTSNWFVCEKIVS